MRVGIIFGGPSREREISFAGGRTVYDNLDKSLFEAVPIFVDSFGNFVLLEWQYIYKGSIRDFYPASHRIPSAIFPIQIYAESLGELDEAAQEALIHDIGQKLSPSALKNHIDFAFLALHGAYGEDGSIQGLLQYIGIPYTASGILPSAIGMDKAFQKDMMGGAGFEVPSYQRVLREDWLGKSDKVQKEIFDSVNTFIGVPIVLKPANQGSSIGAQILQEGDFESFQAAMNRAFFTHTITFDEWERLSREETYVYIRDLSDIREGIGLPLRIFTHENTTVVYHPDELAKTINAHFGVSKEAIKIEALDKESEVVIESFIEGKEFSCVVLRDESGEVIALPPTEIRKGRELFDYRSKYLPGLSRKVTPIELPEEQVQAIREECEDLFTFFRFHVYARIDGFITTDGRVILNDPNTTSGMLPSSFFFHQAAEIGLTPSQFITYIIRASLQERIRTTIASPKLVNMLTTLDQAIVNLQSGGGEKQRIGVVMGGYSSERHISVESGRNIFEKLASSDKYMPIPLFLTGSSEHYELYEIPVSIMLKDNADDIRDKVLYYKKNDMVAKIMEECAAIRAKYAGKSVTLKPRLIPLDTLKKEVDAVFIALHGRPGEDGDLQAKLDGFGVPYNGSGVRSSQTTIDKYETNEIISKKGVFTAKHCLVNRADWEANPIQKLDELEKLFTYPLIAKPVDDGCSSAVKKIDSREEMQAFAQLIFRKEKVLETNAAELLELKPKEEFPQKQVFLVEELIDHTNTAHFLEITGGLLTHFNEQGELVYEMFEPSEALASDAILSLEEKFLAGQGQNITPARYAKDPARRDEIATQVKADLQKVAELLEVQGYARIDAFVKIYDDGRVETFVIEVNSLPGMTPATAIFHQCALNGYTPYAFIDKILEFGMERQGRGLSIL